MHFRQWVNGILLVEILEGGYFFFQFAIQFLARANAICNTNDSVNELV